MGAREAGESGEPADGEVTWPTPAAQCVGGRNRTRVAHPPSHKPPEDGHWFLVRKVLQTAPSVVSSYPFPQKNIVCFISTCSLYKVTRFAVTSF